VGRFHAHQAASPGGEDTPGDRAGAQGGLSGTGILSTVDLFRYSI
jgi:hypothetical protein